MQNDALLDRIRETVSNILRDNAIELVNITYKKEGHVRVLRILADKDVGITIDECARMNGVIGEILDKEDFIGENYILEVSSPGLDRPLKTKNDFLKIKGKRIRVHTYEPIEGKKEFVGVLEAVDDDNIAISDKNAKLTKMPLNKISKATFDYKSLI